MVGNHVLDINAGYWYDVERVEVPPGWSNRSFSTDILMIKVVSNKLRLLTEPVFYRVCFVDAKTDGLDKRFRGDRADSVVRT